MGGGYESIAEEGGDDEEPPAPRLPHTWKTRKKTPVEKLHYYASIITASTIIIVGASAVLNKLPFAKADEFGLLKDHVDRLDKGFNSLQVNQLQSLQLQLMDRRDKLDDQITKAPAALVFDLKTSRNETQQRLDEITSQINQARMSR